MQRLAELKQAADQGDAEAQFNLGLMYAAGRGVPKDDGQAVQWYRRAIDLGHAEAQSRLELMYEEGPAPHAGAAGRAPEVVVAGIQVVRIFEPDNEALLSSPLFSGDNGTKIALWLKMPEGQGLIEIDGYASLVKSVTDDKGSNIGGQFEKSPDSPSDDRSVGMIRIGSTGFAATGATAIVAEGAIAITAAAGTGKTRVANVRLTNGATFRFGQATITVADVETQGDSQTFTLKVPSHVEDLIRDIVILDAKGEPVAFENRGTSFYGDEAGVFMGVMTAAKTITLEFDAWTGLRRIRVPFKVSAGIGTE